jgi:hypothetical protein
MVSGFQNFVRFQSFEVSLNESLKETSFRGSEILKFLGIIFSRFESFRGPKIDVLGFQDSDYVKGKPV